VSAYGLDEKPEPVPKVVVFHTPDLSIFLASLLIAQDSFSLLYSRYRRFSNSILPPYLSQPSRYDKNPPRHQFESPPRSLTAQIDQEPYSPITSSLSDSIRYMSLCSIRTRPKECSKTQRKVTISSRQLRRSASRSFVASSSTIAPLSEIHHKLFWLLPLVAE
jgi:hypothetical protein